MNPTRPDFGATPPGFGPRPTSTNQVFPPRNQYQGQGTTLLQRNQNQGQQYQAQAQKPYQQVDYPPQPPNDHSGVEAMLAKILAQNEKASREVQAQLMDMQTKFERLETHNKMFENQIDQQAESSTRAQGKLPARPEQGQREHCNAVTLRSGKELEDEQPKKKKKVSFDLGGQASAEVEELDEEVPNPQNQKEKEVDKGKDELKPYTPPIPFPQRRTIEDVDTVSLNGECSAILQPRMPPKLEDPGSFSILMLYK
ncbi:unnamed protein product [Rhodiola kirilowii]